MPENYFEDSEAIEFDLLKRRCDGLNLYINVHREADMTRGGQYYIIRKRKITGEHEPSLLRYATLEACWAFVNKYEEISK